MILKQHAISNPTKKTGDRRPRIIFRDIKDLDVVIATDGEVYRRGIAHIGGEDVFVFSNVKHLTGFMVPRNGAITVNAIVHQKEG